MKKTKLLIILLILVTGLYAQEGFNYDESRMPAYTLPDPKGEYLGGYYASPIYHLYGKKGLESAEQPPVGVPVMNQIGYHIRPGKHDVTDFDWEQYIRFSNKHLK